jgi:2-hydroxychromene-2-carboxylate isomerase
MPLPLVTFWFGPGSRYAYLASTQMMALQVELGVRVDWVPVASPMLMARAANTPFAGPPASRQYDPAWRAQDAARWAELYGVPYRDAGDLDLPAERIALACTAAKRGDAGQVFSRALFRAIHVEGRRPDDAVLAEIAESVGRDAAAFMASVDAPETRAAHEAAIEDAVARGVFGVPTFGLEDGQLFWGNDRLPLLRRAIERNRAG